MGWATGYIAKLKAGETVQFRPRGHSMKGRVADRSLVTVEPIDDPRSIDVDDIVLCHVRGNQYLHLVKARKGERFLIGNNVGGLNGWIGANQLFGKLVRVEP
jgi:hypothetical protein